VDTLSSRTKTPTLASKTLLLLLDTALLIRALEGLKPS
jgi:hypothetical protein